MLIRVLQIVREQGWFDLSQPFEKTIHFTRGPALWMRLSRQGRGGVHLKFSELTPLADEARRTQRASLDFPALAPRHLGHAVRAPLEVLASQALDFQAVGAATWLGRVHGVRLVDGVTGYFARMAQLSAARTTGQCRPEWFEALREFNASHPRAREVERELDRLAQALETLPAMAQHGDLVLNNLGLAEGGRLVVFDWEDYGRVDVPGLDLFTLQWSLEQEASSHDGLRDSAHRAARALVSVGCDALMLPEPVYRDLAVAYALVFRWLKRPYGVPIQQRVDRWIDSLLETRPSSS